MVVYAVHPQQNDTGILGISELSILGDEPMSAIPEGNPITHKTLQFSYKMPLLYDFTPYNNFPSWINYANFISATTNVTHYIEYSPDRTGLFTIDGTIPYIELVLPYGYTNLIVNYNNRVSLDTSLYLFINNELKQTSYGGDTLTYEQMYYPPFAVLRIVGQNPMSIIGADLKITLENGSIDTLTFAQGTLVQINNGESQYFNGNYLLYLFQNSSRIVKVDDSYISNTEIYHSTSTSTIIIKYSMIQQLPVSTVYYKNRG